MNKNTNNYMIIIMVLLLVVAIITGAGLCYLSWSDGYSPSGNAGESHVAQTTEGPGQSVQADLDQAKEEGRQEVLDSIKEGLEGNASAEDILNGLLKENDSEGNGDAQGTDNGEQTGSDAQSPAGSEPSNSTENSVSTESSTESDGLQANTLTMADIRITADGEYQYMKDGKVASHKGIDVSKYQGAIDWKKVAADGVEYAFIRVGCRGYGSSGTLIKDETFHQNVKGALAQGIKVGAYFFSQAITVEEALEEAELVIKELGDYDITYPVAIDIERIEHDKARQDALTKEKRTEICIAFLERIKEAGFVPMVYGDTETFAELLDAEQLAGYDFWICETDGQMTFPYEFAIWQYAHTGSVSGIKGDTNISISIKEW